MHQDQEKDSQIAKKGTQQAVRIIRAKDAQACRVTDNRRGLEPRQAFELPSEQEGESDNQIGGAGDAADRRGAAGFQQPE